MTKPRFATINGKDFLIERNFYSGVWQVFEVIDEVPQKNIPYCSGFMTKRECIMRLRDIVIPT